jgi:arabinoxylan arabinofuranohydrolase
MKKLIVSLFAASLVAAFLAGCPAESSDENEEPAPLPADKGPALADQLSAEELAALFTDLTLKTSLKKNYTDHNPLITHNFGADPWGLVYEDRVYLYLTGDALQYKDGQLMVAAYGNIQTLHIISSADLVNWQDHGDVKIGGADGLAPWANNGNGNAWAPCAAYKVLDGKARFFLYWADSSRGIGVLTSTSPTGPWTEPLKGYLVSRDTPTCSADEVVWLFDPAVLVDDDGSAYLYFGGGTDGKPAADPGTGRVVKLANNMIRLAEAPEPLTVPYLFEDSGINKIGDSYYYSYCTNWGTGGNSLGISPSQIAYMTAHSPKGPFTFASKILNAPTAMFPGTAGENNHHSMFQFKGNWYMSYHTETLEKAMKDAGEMPAQLPHPTTGVLQTDSRYRNSHLDAVTVNPDGTIALIDGTMSGVAQVANLAPYKAIEAETIGIMAGISVTEDAVASSKMAVTGINSGDWLALYGVDFGGVGATKFSCRVKAPQSGLGAIQLRLDTPDGVVVGYASIELAEGETGGAYSELTVELPQPLTGVHDLVFVFHGDDWAFDQWHFIQ